jgi:ATP-dependent RNA helicase DDX3X
MTEIQKNVIKLINDGKDVMGCSKTGSGKTIAFLLPIVNKLLSGPVPVIPQQYGVSFPVALVLAPTRELAEQIYTEARKICHKTNLIVSRIYGGVPFPPQLRDIRNGVDIVIATPGRLNDLTKNGHVDLTFTTNLIIDEADRMLDMGFEPQIDEIINAYSMPKTCKRQNLFFSATFPKEVKELARNYMNDHYMISVNNTNEAIVNENIKHKLVRSERGKENSTLVNLVKELKGSILIFSETKSAVNSLEYLLKSNGIKAASIHGDKNQMQRQFVIDDFSNGKVKILIATDVASRGIDFPNISYVINKEIPRNIEDYVHRVGRTGRSGYSGTAITLIRDDETASCQDLLNILKKFKQEIPDWFEEVCRNAKADLQDKRRDRGNRRGGGQNFNRNNGERMDNRNDNDRNFGDRGHMSRGRNDSNDNANSGRSSRDSFDDPNNDRDNLFENMMKEYGKNSDKNLNNKL